MRVHRENYNLQQFSEFMKFCRYNYQPLETNKLNYNDNIIERFKKGNKIKIKEKNKGSFTKYCGGNVTEECIQRGKNSSNPKIRKRATFASNARSWKHK